MATYHTGIQIVSRITGHYSGTSLGFTVPSGVLFHGTISCGVLTPANTATISRNGSTLVTNGGTAVGFHYPPVSYTTHNGSSGNYLATITVSGSLSYCGWTYRDEV